MLTLVSMAWRKFNQICQYALGFEPSNLPLLLSCFLFVVFPLTALTSLPLMLVKD